MVQEDKISRPDSFAGIHAEDCSQEAFKEDQVELARAEMSQVREENARLKMLLEKIEKDYNSLQMRFVGICQPEPVETKNCTNNGVDHDDKEAPSASGNEETELVSLCLGRSSPIEPKKHYDNSTASSSPNGTKEKLHQRYDHLKKEGDLRLTLDFNSLEDCKSDPMEVQTDPSPESSPLRTKDDEGRETWPPSKVLKASKSSGDDDLSQTGVKRARVSVRTRCDTPTMNDGCQWRKYGQKIAKGNPCPRAYYRCTVAPSCPVRKQVQRCAEDTSILITTYEGIHNHPLPFSATAMASTTSAAASMLLSGSSSSQFTSSSSTLIGLNVNLSDNSKSRPYYLPNSSPTSYPTVTLDLTNDPSTTSNQFNMFSSGSFQSIPRLTSTSLSFAPSQPSMLSSVWATGNLNYGANAMPYSKNHLMGSLQPGRTSQEHLSHVPFLQKNYQAAAPSQQDLTETLTKAITSDPSFRSVIAAALTTMVGGASGGASGATQASNDKLEGLGKKLKWVDQTTVVTSSNPLGPNGKGCASSFLNQSYFSTPQSVSSRKQPPQPPFSISKGAASATTSENVDQTNRMLLE